ncbi:unnamed protein product [Paramecium octaurelia]|uniref:Uncharacterized protein n=1 Tax=Paramecium octaurelia TaxID=43137 RepID=A0A8S1VNG5_PAROT|nr:unnamed protein product [Paramecium octaurelia]
MNSKFKSKNYNYRQGIQGEQCNILSKNYIEQSEQLEKKSQNIKQSKKYISPNESLS